ncbi:MAG TPA: Ni/Fe hydrogenase subunit alpha [Candidatus Limnocylindrales bacterium]
MTHETAVGDERRFNVSYITRVEGEGSLHLRIRDGEVLEAKLGIFEAPRYFEQLVVGRTPDAVIDIVARICGICPIAYQMSAVHAFESAFGVEISPEVRALRRLLYCGEWIQSHALHIYLLHAPDFLGYPSAIAMAPDRPEVVARGLAIKKLGNQLISILGARSIHPVSVRVGGFYRVPRREELEPLAEKLDEAVRLAEETVDMVAAFEAPAFDREAKLVALRHPAEYPYNDGRIVSNDGLDLPIDCWDDAFEERHLAHSNALHARTKAGEVYLLGPSARIVLAGEQLHPLAAAALARSGFAERIRTNIYWSIGARAIELLHACAEARDIVAGYRAPDEASVAWEPRPGRAAWATEAPRGLLFHRYEVDERGLVSGAQIVPPTSQNQGAIEQDLALFAPSVLSLPHEEATLRLEQLIRSYDPCISCATHFLDLTMEEG